jgi:uncharacterized protein with PQ loop repeat
MISIEGTIATCTIIATLSLKLIGFPSQIKKIRDTASTEGISITYFVLGFITYTLWTLHGILINDTTVIIGQGLGVFACGILLAVIYKTKRKSIS